MPFDLNAALASVKTTFEYDVLDPFTNRPSGWVWTLATPANAEARGEVFALARKPSVPRGGNTYSQEQTMIAEHIAALAIGWRGLEEAGKDVPFSPQAAKALLSKPTAFWLREQIMAALSDPTNAFEVK